MTATVPFTVLTGFLGAGKTSVLNRVLAAPQGRRVAVLVNELGRVAIDSDLILGRGGDVLELAGGCVCCKIDVKNDLWDGIADVVARSAPDNVVLETTGIAEPAAILDELPRAPMVKLAGVVCVVDADAGPAQLGRRAEAAAQVEVADRVLLSKLDLADAGGLAALHARLDELNATAERAGFPLSPDGTAALVPWLLEARARGARSRRAHGHAHTHDHLHQTVAVSFVDDGALLPDRLLAVVAGLRDRLLRVKGTVAIAGEPRRGFLELAGRQLELRYGEPWADEPPATKLVLIGEGLDDAALRRQLYACRSVRSAGQ